MHFVFFFFFFNDTATTEIYTLSLHDALPISLVLHSIERTVWIIKLNSVIVAVADDGLRLCLSTNSFKSYISKLSIS